MGEALLAGLLGAVAAAIGFGLAFALRPQIKRISVHPAWQKHGHVLVGGIFFLIAFLVLRALAGMGVPGESGEDKAMRELRGVPVFAAILEADPVAEAEIRQIVREGLRTNDQAAITRRFAEFTRARVPKYFKAASDDSAISFARAIVPIFRQMEASDVNACKRGVLTGDVGIGVAQNTPDAATKPLIDAMAAVVRSSTKQPQPPPDPTRAAAAIGQAMKLLYGSNDTKLVPAQTFTNPASLQAAPADRLCYTGRRIYETILTLPPAEASQALRFMLAGGG